VRVLCPVFGSDPRTSSAEAQAKQSIKTVETQIKHKGWNICSGIVFVTCANKLILNEDFTGGG